MTSELEFPSMIPIFDPTSTLGTTLMAMIADSNPERRAYGEGLLLEERLSAERVEAYALVVNSRASTPDGWVEAHNAYVKGTCYTAEPETFCGINAEAEISDLLDPELHLIRLEGIDWLLRARGLELDTVSNAADILRTGRAMPNMDGDQALAIAEEVCQAFNISPAGDHPKFASFLDDVLDCLPENSMNWPEALRDRLGLGHYHADASPIPVALFRYPVSSVLQRKLEGSGITHRLAVPTALDGKLSPYFHPTPGDISPSFGRIVDLSHDENCERQNAEILHLRIDYEPRYLVGAGAITTPIPVIPPLSPDSENATPLEKLREDHLFCLQYESGRDDFHVPELDGST